MLLLRHLLCHLALLFTTIRCINVINAERHTLVTPSAFDSANIPWLAGTGAASAHEDLHNQQLKLLRLQKSVDGWVTVFVFNKAVTHMALNCLYSYVKFGQGRHYVVATLDEASLQACMLHRLPCYNASHVLQAMGQHNASSHGAEYLSKSYMSIVWAKVHVLQEVLSAGFNVHFSDVDVVYLQPVWPYYMAIFEEFEVDAIFMQEDIGLNLINTGVYAIRSSKRTMQLVSKWLAGQSSNAHDQKLFNSMAFKDYVFCSEPRMCEAATRAGWATVYRHVPQFPVVGACPRGGLFDEAPCDPSRLYVHAICRTDWRTKAQLFRTLRLMLVDSKGQPLYSEDMEGHAHEFLPCAHGLPPSTPPPPSN